MSVASMKKPIPKADRPEVNAAADYCEALAEQLTSDAADLLFQGKGAQWREDRAAALHRHARALRRIGCTNRAGHAILRKESTCAGCGCAPADDEVRPIPEGLR